jgi:hypothetical protein
MSQNTIRGDDCMDAGGRVTQGAVTETVAPAGTGYIEII